MLASGAVARNGIDFDGSLQWLDALRCSRKRLSTARYGG